MGEAKLILKSVAEEAEDCRIRCAGMQVGDPCLLIHHEGSLIETLTEPPENRIQCFLTVKAKEEKEWQIALRLRLMGPVIVDDAVRADTAWSKAHTAWSKAYANWRKAYTAWSKAHDAYYAARSKAYADRSKADAAVSKAYTAWSKADVVRSNAYAVLCNADAERMKAYATHYRRLFPDSPWNGVTIFAGEFALEVHP